MQAIESFDKSGQHDESFEPIFEIDDIISYK